jgi:nanoRNase/pAp phosphatase (c-di-AMP/oligoRNAs hydrolase)
MAFVFVCPDARLWKLTAAARPGGARPLHVVERPATAAAITRGGGRATAGDLESEALYRRVLGGRAEAVVVAVPARRRRRVLGAIRRVHPHIPVVALTEARRAGGESRSFGTLVEQLIVSEARQAAARARVERLRAHFRGAERVLIMMQDDPDPDAIASAFALRVLLGRTGRSATIGTFGTIGRAENRAMTRILEIDVEAVTTAALDSFDRVAMVDTQPGFFEESFRRVDLVIDHHPRSGPVTAAIADIRPAFGATSTIMTEYLRAAGTAIGERLATALLYGIKADTLYLERGATRADMEAFAFLHERANHNALRRIERPQLPDPAFDALAQAIARRHVVDGVLVTHVSKAAYPELVAQFADLFLQTEGIEWSVVSGIVGRDLHVSVRNVGYVRGAGEVVQEAFAGLGRAGGHRAMAKAVVPLDAWRAAGHGLDDDAITRAVSDRVLRVLAAERRLQ